MGSSFSVNVLASGSKGNSTLIIVDDTAVLIDAGISCRRMVAGLRECHLEPQDVSAVLITHEHIDHVKGLPVFSKKYDVPLYANEKTWMYMRERSVIKKESIRVLPKKFVIGNIAIEPFKLSHDAANPVGYTIRSGKEKCTYLTDTGYVTPAAREAASDSSVLVLEANHDEEMLRNGFYPPELQRRILGKKGHLSNVAAGELLAELAHLPEVVILAHLSEQNNLPSVAVNTIEKLLAGRRDRSEMQLFVARQDGLVSNNRQELGLW